MDRMDGRLKIDEMGFADLVAAESVLHRRRVDVYGFLECARLEVDERRLHAVTVRLDAALVAVRARIDEMTDALAEETTCTTSPK